MSTGVRAKREKIKPEVLKPCLHCGQPFVISRRHVKFCSRACVGYGSRCADRRSKAGASKCLQPYYTQHDRLLGLKPSLDWLYKEDSNA
jgi:hypothetical protein